MNQVLRDSAASVRTVDDFKKWTASCIRPLLPHGSLLSGLGHLHAGGVGLDYIVMVDYPVGHIEAIRNRAGAIDTPVLRRWLTKQAPVLFDGDDPWEETPQVWLDSFRQFQLRNVVAHGVLDKERCIGTYHSFYQIPGTPDKGYMDAVQTLTPMLHEVFCRVIENYRSTGHSDATLGALTERERDLLQWIGLGKTNTEIARLANLSESTVKHHVTRIFDKLGMANRAQLVRYLAEHEIRQTLGPGTTLL